MHVPTRFSAAKLVPSIARDQRGLTSGEYVVIFVLVCATALSVWNLLGNQLRCKLGLVTGAVASALSVDSAGSEYAECEPLALAGSGSLTGTEASAGGGDESGSAGGGSSAGSAAGHTGAENAGPGGAGDNRQSKPGGGKKGGTTPTPVDQWTNDVRSIMCPADAAFLKDLQKRGVTVTVYDDIYFDDPYYDGTKWTTKKFPAAGATNGKRIEAVISTDPAENAATLYHEGVHTGQTGGKWRDREYDAYVKEDQWRISHGLPPHSPSFRTTVAGKPATDVAAIRRFVDGDYPGVSAPSPTGGPPEEVVGRTKDGRTIVERADGSQYVRPAQKGDSFAGPKTKKPKNGRRVDMAKLQC